MHIQLQGETLWLDAGRALVWPAQSMVLVADTHFGKSAVFRRQGLAVPEGNDPDDLSRLSKLVQTHRARRLCILGDFVHGALPHRHHFYTRFNQWRAGLEADVDIVLGNHDRYLNTAILKNVHWHSRLHVGPFALVHDPEDATEGYYLCGHIHPVVKLVTRADALRMPVFWQRRQGMVLPSFGSFTGGYVIERHASERCYGVGPESVVALP
ncbi:MAG: ligase-associated DNA damage response endonuclease PdeM [Pseudomonadota bacterium]